MTKVKKDNNLQNLYKEEEKNFILSQSSITSWIFQVRYIMMIDLMRQHSKINIKQ